MDVSTLPCEIKWRPLQPLLLLINAFLNDCQRLEDGPYGRLVWWEALRLAWSPETCVAAAQCSCARVWCSSLTDIWQQLFEQQYIAVNMHRSLSHPSSEKPYQQRHRLKPTRRNMFIRNQWGTSMSWSMQHLTETWSATSRASLIKRQISGEIVLMRVSKPKTNRRFSIMCFSVTVMTFKGYITAVMDKLTCFVSQSKVRIAARRVLLQICLSCAP